MRNVGQTSGVGQDNLDRGSPHRARYRSPRRPRPHASDPPNRRPRSSALVLLLLGLALAAVERERPGSPYTGPPGGYFLLNLWRRSLADRDSLGVSLRGLCAARSSGQLAPGRRVWPPLFSSPLWFPSQTLACAAQGAP